MNESEIDNVEPIVKFAQELWQDASANMEPHHKLWLKNWQYYRGKQWENARGEGLYQVTANVMGALINQSIAHQTTVRPGTRRQPLLTNDKTIEGCELMNKLDPIIWEELKMSQILEQGLLNVQLCRFGVLQRYYDPRANKGMGGYRLLNRSPFSVFFDPCMKTDDIQNDQDYMFTAEPVSMAYIRRHFPQKAHLVRQFAKTADVGQEDREKNEASARGDFSGHSVETYTPGTETPYTVFQKGGDPGDYGRRKVNLYNLYVRTDFIKSENKFYQDHNPGFGNFENSDIETDWRVVTYTDGGIKLGDKGSNFFNGEVPFLFLSTGPLSDSFMTYDECEQLIPLQNTYNQLFSLIVDHTANMANPAHFISSQAGLDEKWFQKAGKGLARRIYKVRGSASGAVTTDRPQNLGPEVLATLRESVRIMEMIIAQPEILQGERPSGARSGEALKVLASQAMPRTTKKTHRYEECVKNVVETVMLDYLTSLPEVLDKVVGDELVRMHPQDLIDLAITTEVIPGSSLPSYHDQKLERIISFAQAMQGMDPNFVQMIAENADVPEIRELFKGGGGGQGGPAQLGPGQGPGGATEVPLQAQQLPNNLPIAV